MINGNTNPATAPPTGLGIPLHGSGQIPDRHGAGRCAVFRRGMFQDRQQDRRKIIFLISDGSNSRQNRHTFNETAARAAAQGRSVYSISVSHSVPVPVGKSIVERGLAALQKYAVDTGGDTFYGGETNRPRATLFRRDRRSAQSIHAHLFSQAAWIRATISIRLKFACDARA